MTRCPFCDWPIAELRIEHVHRWDGKLSLLRNVPVEVCEQCEEVFFAPETLKLMDSIAAGEQDPDEHVSVPVYVL